MHFFCKINSLQVMILAILADGIPMSATQIQHQVNRISTDFSDVLFHDNPQIKIRMGCNGYVVTENTTKGALEKLNKFDFVQRGRDGNYQISYIGVFFNQRWPLASCMPFLCRMPLGQVIALKFSAEQEGWSPYGVIFTGVNQVFKQAVATMLDKNSCHSVQERNTLAEVERRWGFDMEISLGNMDYYLGALVGLGLIEFRNTNQNLGSRQGERSAIYRIYPQGQQLSQIWFSAINRS